MTRMGMKVAVAIVGLLLAGPAAAQMAAPLTCLLVPARTSDIGSDRSGIVIAVEVTRGDFVEAGDPLVHFDTRLAEADLQVAQITIDGLQERLGRSEGLLNRNLISRDEIEALRTDLALASAEQARAQIEVERGTIRAPFAGYVAEVAIAVGELIGPEPLLRIIEVSELEAELVFLAGAFGEFSIGQDIALSVELTQANVAASVTAIDPFIDPTSNTFTVRAGIDNSDRAIPAGSSCAVAN
ncbi:efflux RND transporter periplasmic adaptor subunit [Rhodobacteraceae bacterium M385]|nr:efflux RND transporter periplasmic adaptor subunit [Rhodobacteraceae bacterium M385]